MSQSNETHSEAATLGKIIGQHHQRFCIPLFQRTYQWEEKEINEFWDDIFSLLNAEADEINFLGAFVVQSKSKSTLRTQELIVIDGQQRLTTIFLTLLAAAKKADELGDKDFRVNNIQRRFLQCSSSEDDGKFRLEPTPFDKQQFNEIFKSFETDRLKLFRAQAGTVNTVSVAFELISKKLEEALEILGDSQKTETIETFLERLLTGIEAVIITLPEGRNSHEVFDRLNNFGIKLQVIDLVRNEIFQKVENNHDQLYTEKWNPFEQELRESFKTAGITGKEADKKIDGFFWPYLLIHHETAAKTKIFGELRDYWTSIEGKGINSEAAELILDDLDKWLPPYFALVIGRKPDGIGKLFWEQLLELNRMGINVVAYPYLMKLIYENIRDGKAHTDANCAHICRLIESFIVRRALVGHEPSGLHAIFKVLWKKAKSDPIKVRKNLESSTIKFPLDEEVKQAVQEEGMYKRSLASFILMTHELSLQKTKKEAYKILPEPTIDHVLPQKLPASWSDKISKAEHSSVVDTWGNLVLLTHKLNASKSNKVFKDIKKEISENTVFETAKKVCQNDDWGIEAIKSRNKELAAWAISYWKAE